VNPKRDDRRLGFVGDRRVLEVVQTVEVSLLLQNQGELEDPAGVFEEGGDGSLVVFARKRVGGRKREGEDDVDVELKGVAEEDVRGEERGVVSFAASFVE